MPEMSMTKRIKMTPAGTGDTGVTAGKGENLDRWLITVGDARLIVLPVHGARGIITAIHTAAVIYNNCGVVVGDGDNSIAVDC